MNAPADLTLALEAALVREMMGAWRHVNDAHFGGALTAPTLDLVDTRTTLGRWRLNTRTLEISRPLVLEQPWWAVVEVLKHEMAHQYVHEVLCETSEVPHGPAFRAVCARLGVDARASGLPDASSIREENGRDKIVERIARLLALAESANRHEAEAAMTAAQRLMLKHNTDAVLTGRARDYGFAHLGAPTGRVAEHERIVAMILGKHFFVEAIWVPAYRPLEGKRGSVLEICGSPANLATAEYVHGFLHETAQRLWRDHKAARCLRSDRDRRAYLAGVMVGFADKLTRHAEKSRSEGIVWVRDGDLDVYFRRRHPRVRHIRHAGPRRTEAWANGRAAGRQIVLHKPLETAASSRGRMLPAKSSP